MILSSQMIAFLTMLLGVLSLFVGYGICWRLKIPLKYVGTFVTYSFTVAPLIFLLWNCIGAVIMSLPTQNMEQPVSTTTLDASFNVGTTMIGFSVLYSFLNITNDLIVAIQAAIKSKGLE